MTIFSVKGVSHFKDDISLVLKDIFYEHDIPNSTRFYGDRTPSEIREELTLFNESNDVLFKYENINTENVTFVPEPDNIHDPNAIKVLIHDTHIGYVPKELTQTVLDFLNTDTTKYRTSVRADVSGGPIKYYDWQKDKVVEDAKRYNIGFYIWLHVFEKEEISSSVYSYTTDITNHDTQTNDKSPLDYLLDPDCCSCGCISIFVFIVLFLFIFIATNIFK